ncbi:hypothetical protein P7K49_016914, partial [Saguinus oedipus]
VLGFLPLAPEQGLAAPSGEMWRGPGFEANEEAGEISDLMTCESVMLFLEELLAAVNLYWM